MWKLFISVILILLCITSWKCQHTYESETQFTDVCGNVYQKYNSPSKYGPKFIMVVRADNGRVFDLEVTASTYAMYDISDRICFPKIRRVYVDNNYQSYTGVISLTWRILNVLFALIIGCGGFYMLMIKIFCNDEL